MAARARTLQSTEDMPSTSISPRLWIGAGLLSALLVHAAAGATILLPALPATRSWIGLRDALPGIRAVATGAGVLASLGLVALAIGGRLSWRRAGLGAAVIVALVATGSLYGCSETVRVERRPVATAPAPDGTRAFDHGAFDRVLARFVDEHGMVDYLGLKANRGLLDEYVGQLASASPRSNPDLFPTPEHRTAYWINAYNALMLRAVVDHYPVRSVKDIRAAHGVFNRLHFPVGGQAMTLDDIEKGILLVEFDDPRVHFALTCASMSCPRLDRRAFHADGLSARLDGKGREFLRSPDGIRLDADRSTVFLSKYFDWYADDFGDDHLAFVAPYLTAEQQATLARIPAPRVAHLDYDWRLNDQAAPWHAR
jgi:hypothetical protein